MHNNRSNNEKTLKYNSDHLLMMEHQIATGTCVHGAATKVQPMTQPHCYVLLVSNESCKRTSVYSGLPQWCPVVGNQLHHKHATEELQSFIRLIGKTGATLILPPKSGLDEHR